MTNPRRCLAVLAGVFLCGCGTPTFDAYITDVTDPAALASDRAACLVRAQGYVAPNDPKSFVTAAGVGAGGNLADVVINPLVPALGAVGAVGVAGLKALGLNSTDRQRVYLRCLEHRGQRSGAYDMLDPNL